MRRVRAVLRGAGRALAIATALLAVLASYVWLTSDDVDRARFAPPADAVTVLDRHGQPIRVAQPEGDRRWARLSEISPHFLAAVIAVEDQRFHEHAGVDPRATLRALATSWLPGRRLSGASTITQQLIKLVYGRPDGLLDKPREIARALRLESQEDKAWILEQYVNRLPFGNGIHGVARASEAYFGKPPSELSAAEAALLAGIPQAPSATEPRRHLRRALGRRDLVLARMRATGHLDARAHAAALAERPRIREREVRPFRAPRFAEAALAALRDGGLDRRGATLPTSLDLALQDRAEAIVGERVASLRSGGAQNGAAVVVLNATGEILAYVGAVDSDGAGGQMDLLRARRQPGSTLKPFVYELFFERGGSPASVLDDFDQPMVGHAGELVTARDYDGAERGPVRARVALSASLNLAALDAARHVGADRIVERLDRLGVGELGPASRYGPAIVLGGADVTALELAAMYAALARGGSFVPLRLVPGEAIEGERVMDASAARLTADVLADARARRAGFGDDLSALFGPGRFARKPGTSPGWRAAWTAAFTDEVTVVVWLGDPAGRPMQGVSGFRGAAPAAVRLLSEAQARLPALSVPALERDDPPLATARVCAQSGLLVGASCPHAVEERFAMDRMPHEVCAAHDGSGRWLVSGRYARWLERARPAEVALAAPRADEAVRVAHPEEGARLLIDPRHPTAIPLRATVSGSGPPVAQSSSSAVWTTGVVAPLSAKPFESERWSPAPGTHTLVAVLGARRSEPVTVSVVGAAR